MHLRPPTPRSRLLALAFLIAAPPLARAATAAPAPTANGQATTGPHLVVEQRSHDFGLVQKGTKLAHTFVIRNQGTQPLEISDVQASCGCTTASDWTRTIAPGASGSIPVHFDSTQFTGPIVKTITLTSNCVRNPVTTLEIKAVVRTPITLSHPVVIFPSATDPSQSQVRSVTIRHESDGVLQLTDLVVDKPAFKPSLKETVPGREFELQIATVPPLEKGTHTARITMKSSNPDMPLITVQVVATVLPPVQVAPTSINFTGQPLAAPEKRYIVVLNHRGGDLVLSDLESNVPGVTFEPQRSPDGRQITIAVTFPAGFDARAPEQRYLRGKTSHPSTPTFEVPVVYAGPR